MARPKPKTLKQQHKLKQIHANVDVNLPSKSPAGHPLTPVQRIQVEIIDWKRCAIRWLLFLAWATIFHFIGYISVFSYGNALVSESVYLQWGFYGFFFNLSLYFFGAGCAIDGISYVWSPLKFTAGILMIFAGGCLSVGLSLLGGKTTSEVKDGIPLHYFADCEIFKAPNGTEILRLTLVQKKKLRKVCELLEKTVVRSAIKVLPVTLPPIAMACVIGAIISIFCALYIAPRKGPPGAEVDAVWLEPYEIYDFYVGRGAKDKKGGGSPGGSTEVSIKNTV